MASSTTTEASVPPRWRARGAILLLSCYELGRQPLNLASPWAAFQAAGFGVAGADTAIDPLDDASIDAALLVAISVPMHTALRLAVELAGRIRERAPRAHLCFYGLYALLNADYLLSQGIADSVLGGEIEETLVALATRLATRGTSDVDGVTTAGAGGVARPVLRKLPFALPVRDGLPPAERYATLLGPGPGERRVAGYVEASRGCRYQCRHCPLTPVYRGRFFVLPADVVLADAAQQIARGARHITFGDPDFFCGPKHAMRVARRLAAEHPGVSFDVTTKVEHILRYRAELGELGELGCAFVISAVESLSDRVLTELDKGHSRADALEALTICRDLGLPLRPSFVAFTPWTTLGDYLELVDAIVSQGLIDHVEPVQLAVRLLIPPGSALLWRAEERPWLGELVAAELSYRWHHPDPRMDELFRQVSAELEADPDADAGEQIERVRLLAYRVAGRPAPILDAQPRRFVPRMSESWFCCAEPNPAQLEHLGDHGFCAGAGK
jgi:hypothetical protein